MTTCWICGSCDHLTCQSRGFGMGPSCPQCGTSVEWTLGEVWEEVFGDKLYTCSACFNLFVISQKEILKEQATAREMVFGDEEDNYDNVSDDSASEEKVEWDPPEEEDD